MDRTAWIIIGICAALLGLNIYMGNNTKAETAPIPAPQTAVAAANAPVAGVRPGAGTSAPEQASGAVFYGEKAGALLRKRPGTGIINWYNRFTPRLPQNRGGSVTF